jgi:hypothetical protein
MWVATQKWKCIVQFLYNGFVPYGRLEPATVKTENVPQSFQQLDSEFKMNNPCWIFLQMWDQMKIYNVSSWVFFFLGQSFATSQPKKSSVTHPKDFCELKNTKVARIQGIFFFWKLPCLQ